MSDLDTWSCPTCGVQRPDEYHLDWCDYDGPEDAETDR